MIFQAGIKLDVENRNVQVNLDFDTGLIGFTEKIDGEIKEYFYAESPLEFKRAFLERFDDCYTEDRYINAKICRKNPNVMKLTKELLEINKY